MNTCAEKIQGKVGLAVFKLINGQVMSLVALGWFSVFLALSWLGCLGKFHGAYRSVHVRYS